jgi:hypothetical protein
MPPRRLRLLQVATVGILGAVLLAVLAVRTVNQEGPSLPPPAAVAGLSILSSLMPTMASECAHGGCTNEAASDEDLASLRRFLGATFWIQGARVRDRHGVLRGLSASAQDGAGDDLELAAVSTPSVPAHWARTIDDATAQVNRRILRTTQGRGSWSTEPRWSHGATGSSHRCGILPGRGRMPTNCTYRRSGLPQNSLVPRAEATQVYDLGKSMYDAATPFRESSW